jgi:OOP family OmpA-OmpF porin
LAAVIRGTAPNELRRVMQDALDSIYVEQHEALELFTGDAAPFAASRPHLESCIQMQTEAVVRKRPSAILLAAAGLILLALGVWLFFSIRESRRWNDYLGRLGSEPGLLVVSAEKRGGKYYITGLRDSMAVDPVTLLPASKIDPQEVAARWEPYQSSHPDFVLARVNRLLDPPRTVTLSVEDGVLVARGSAPHDWISAARKVAQMMPGVSRLDEENLVDIDTARSELQSVTQKIEQHAIRFAVGSAELAPDQREELKVVMLEIQRLQILAQSLGAPSRVEVWGHADQSGSQELNDQLIPARAGQVMSALLAIGAKPTDVEIADHKASSKVREYNRTATFRVKQTDASTGNK